MRHEPLVELVVAGHEHGQRLLLLAPCSACLLPERGDGAREPVEHAGVEPADVDAQLQRVGGDDAAQLAVGQRLLDLAALLGQVAAAVGPHRVVEVGGQPPAGGGSHHLGAAAAAAEADGPVAAADQLGEQLRGVAVAVAALGPPQRHQSLAAG
jgi:hypothetical protein